MYIFPYNRIYHKTRGDYSYLRFRLWYSNLLFITLILILHDQSSNSSVFNVSLEIHHFVIVRAVIDLILPGGVIHSTVPGKVNRPGTGAPLSHFIVIFNWWSWSCWVSHPVHNGIIESWIINTKRPWLPPSISGSIICSLEESDSINVFMMSKTYGCRKADKSNNRLHYFNKYIL